MSIFKRKKKSKRIVNIKYGERIEVIEGKIKRRFSLVWQRNGNFREDEMIVYLQGVKAQRKVMIEYIEELHNYIDQLNDL